MMQGSRECMIQGSREGSTEQAKEIYWTRTMPLCRTCPSLLCLGHRTGCSREESTQANQSPARYYAYHIP